MSWFVFTEEELQELEESPYDMAERFRKDGEWTDDGTLLVDAKGSEAFILTGNFNWYPRRMAIDPPTNTLPRNTKLSEIDDEYL